MEDKQQEISGQVVAGIGWVYLSTFLKAISQIVFIAVLSRLLTPRDFGLVGIALVFTNLAERVGQLGITQALVQKEGLLEEDWKVARSLSWLLGLLVAISFYFLASPVAVFFSEPNLVGILQVLSMMFIFEGLCITLDGWLTKHLQFKSITIAENLSYFIGYCLVAMPMAFLDWGVWSLVGGQIAIRVCKYLLLRGMATLPSGFAFSLSRAQSLLRLGIGFSLGRLLNFTALQGDNFIVGKVLGTQSLGLYTRVYQLMTIPSVYVAQVLDKVLFPALALKQKEIVKVKEGMLILTELVSLLSLPLCAVCLALPEMIVRVILGGQWIEAAPILRIFAVGIFFRAGYKASDLVLRSLGRVYRYSFLQAVYALLVIGGVLFGSQFGLTGVAFAVLLAVAMNHFLLSASALRAISLSWSEFFLAHLPGVWVGTFVFISGIFVKWITTGSELSPFIVFCFATVLCGMGAFLAVILAPTPCFPRSVEKLRQRSALKAHFERLPRFVRKSLRL